MENKTLFSEILERQSDLLERIRHAAHEAHAAVNQFYGVDLPYSYHLDGVAELVARYGGEVCTRAEDVPAVIPRQYRGCPSDVQRRAETRPVFGAGRGTGVHGGGDCVRVDERKRAYTCRACGREIL